MCPMAGEAGLAPTITITGRVGPCPDDNIQHSIGNITLMIPTQNTQSNSQTRPAVEVPPGEQWRLLVTSGLDGASSMALDTAILEQVGAGHSPPTLRLYDWQPACLTLGIAQPYSDVDRARLAAHGWDITRRPTGGRAILHTDEITYSVTLPRDHPIAEGDIVTSYRRLSAALLHALQALGLRARADQADDHLREADKGPVCFEVPANYEITADGKKLVGSAQVRKHGALLQHGALPLHGDIARICDALAFPSEAARLRAKARVRERATTLEAVLGRRIPWHSAAEALVAAFRETFALDMGAPEGPVAVEQARMAELRSEVYAAEAWIQRL